jgi:hypothetical protein
MVFSLNDEYEGPDYSPAPSPTPWYPPPPPTSDYAPPQTHYVPPRTRYRPPRTYYRPRRPQFHPCTYPPPRRHPRFENRTSHVTATRRVHATTRNEYIGPPRYVPPALRNNIKTSYRSQHTQSGMYQGIYQTFEVRRTRAFAHWRGMLLWHSWSSSADPLFVASICMRNLQQVVSA